MRKEPRVKKNEYINSFFITYSINRYVVLEKIRFPPITGTLNRNLKASSVCDLLMWRLYPVSRGFLSSVLSAEVPRIWSTLCVVLIGYLGVGDFPCTPCQEMYFKRPKSHTYLEDNLESEFRCTALNCLTNGDHPQGHRASPSVWLYSGPVYWAPMSSQNARVITPAARPRILSTRSPIPAFSPLTLHHESKHSNWGQREVLLKSDF